MKTLEECRVDIDRIDREMVKLFEERMTVVDDVSNYKRANNLPVYDEAREKKVIEKNSLLVQNPEFVEYYKKFIQAMMDISKEYQHSKDEK